MGNTTFVEYQQLSEKSKHNAYLNYITLVRSIQFTHFEMQEAPKHVYLKNGTYADKTEGGVWMLERMRQGLPMNI